MRTVQGANQMDLVGVQQKEFWFFLVHAQHWKHEKQAAVSDEIAINDTAVI